MLNTCKPIQIETPRLKLSIISLKDINLIYDLYSRKEILIYTDNSILQTISESENLIKKNLLLSENETFIWLKIQLKESDEFCGIIKLDKFDNVHLFASLGCILLKTKWNKGIMTEALASFINYIFANTKINRLEAQIFEGNLASIRLFNKLKFTFEGKLRENFSIENRLENSLLYSFIRSDLNTS